MEPMDTSTISSSRKASLAVEEEEELEGLGVDLVGLEVKEVVVEDCSGRSKPKTYIYFISTQ